MSDALPSKDRVGGSLRRHFFLRLHMTVIVGGTFAAGLMTTKLLLFVHVNNLALRYAFAVSAAYAVFLGFIKLWLFYVGIVARSYRNSALDPDANWVNFLDFSSSGVDVQMPSFGGGGGKFGGGGASGSWGDVQDVVTAPVKSASGGGHSLELDFDFGDDLGLVILVIVLVVAIAASAFYVIYAAPAILTEAAFNAALAGALARRAKHISFGTWVGSVVRSTILPFLIVLALAITTGWYAQKHCPTATRLREAFRCGRTG